MKRIVYKWDIFERVFNFIVNPLNAKFKFPAHHNIKYSNRKILETIIYSALLSQYIESSVKQISLLKENVPSADTIFRRFKNINWHDVLDNFNDINYDLYKKWNKKPKKPAYLALDAHDIPRYIRKIRRHRPRIKKCDDIDYIVGTKANRGTHYCHKILSIDIVEDE